jgi:predicted ArsR family transcriptional regulator
MSRRWPSEIPPTRRRREIRHTGVVKIRAGQGGPPVPADRTRDAVARLVLERGPQSALDLANRLGLSAAGIRRHLDALVADGLLTECESKRPVTRGRGRPARMYAVTDAGRAAFPHAYDELATTALRYLRSANGDDGVHAFAEHRAQVLEHDLAPGLPDSGADARARALALALTAHGYAAGIEDGAAPGVDGVQICQHHCPIADVAQEFPELCEAETRAFERLLGTYVQRLATIAHGDGVCTTHIPLSAPRVRPGTEPSPQSIQSVQPVQPAQTGSRK